MLNALKIVLLSMLLTACSWSDIVGMVVPSKRGGIDTEIVVGDKKQVVSTKIGEQTQTAQTIINESTAYLPWGIALIALMLPTPTTMWNAWRKRNVS